VSDSVGLCRIVSDYVGFCRILSDSVGLCRIMSDYVGFATLFQQSVAMPYYLVEVLLKSSCKYVEKALRGVATMSVAKALDLCFSVAKMLNRNKKTPLNQKEFRGVLILILVG